MKNIYETIGQAMARIRRSQEKKWTQEDVAERLGIDRTVYAKFETGKLKINYEYIKKFCQLFDIMLKNVLIVLFKKVNQILFIYLMVIKV